MIDPKTQEAIDFLSSLYALRDKAINEEWGQKILGILAEEGYIPYSRVPFTKDLISDILAAEYKQSAESLSARGFPVEEYEEKKEAIEEAWIELSGEIHTDKNGQVNLNENLVVSVVTMVWMILTDVDFTERGRQFPCTASDYADRGCYYASQGREEEALECFEEAVEREGDNAWYLQNKAWVLRELKRRTEAEQVYKKALEVEKETENKFKLHLELAQFKREQENYREAIKHLLFALSCYVYGVLRGKPTGTGAPVLIDVGEKFYLNCSSILSDVLSVLSELDKIPPSDEIQKDKEMVLARARFIVTRLEQLELRAMIT